MKIVAPENWIPCDGVVLENNANVAVKEKGNILVVAGPGAGVLSIVLRKFLQTS